MSFKELLAELPKLTPTEREEVIRRLMELDEVKADQVAEARVQELDNGGVQPKTQEEIFRKARAALG